MRVLAALTAVLLLTTALAPYAATANEPPLADAGLDQTVTRGTTVHLDASGSRDPDGSIDSFEWSIRTPNGTNTTPDCPTCAPTHFDPDQVGTYEATVTVTDDDGATARDTLYVEVEPGDPPAITVAGPTEAQVGTDLGYTATLEAGTAPLDTLTWRIDGETVRTESIPGTHRRFDLPHAFQSPGSHEVTATVTDSDELSATDSLTVEIDAASPPSDGGSESPDDGTSGDGSDAPYLADQHTPIVRGEQLVTGTAPFTETYHLDVKPSVVESVAWWRDGQHAGTGSATTIAWPPGTHSLYAIIEYTDGSVETARFSNGTTDVEVDPEPQVSLAQTDGFGSLSGVLRATDEFENLQSVSVSIDGTPVASKDIDPLELRSGQSGDRLDLPFNYTDISPGETHRVVLQARDARGQVAETVEMVEAVGIPEIVSSGFVNSPVDSYHPRLDPERYTAKHVMKVKLNGLDGEDVKIDQYNRSAGINHHGSDRRTSEFAGEKHLNITTYWSGDRPKIYNSSTSILYSYGDEIYREIDQSSFLVTPSPPEPVVEVVSDGTPDDAKAKWGIVVDASRSFDPDGTGLRFHWQDGARAISEDEATAKFNSFDFNGLVIEDGDDQTTAVSGLEFLQHFVPSVDTVEPRTEGPFKPNDTVTFEFTTEGFELPKMTDYDETEISLRIDDERGWIDEWGCSVVGPLDRSVMDSHDWDCEILQPTDVVTSRGHHFYSGTVTFEASAFTEGDRPDIYLYNENTPDQSARRLQLPEITVLEEGDKSVSNVEVLETSYRVEEPVIVRKETPFESVRDQYLDQGFSVERTEMSGTEYSLERHEQVQEAIYETENLTFDTRGVRNTFLQSNPEWERGETMSELREWTTTEQEWRDEKTGPGEFTGSTREIEIAPAEYRHEKQYRHYYTEEKTETRPVTRQRTVQVPVTRYRTTPICDASGCYVEEEPYTDWVTRTETYVTTETYTYTVTESSTYWSTNKLHADDEYTGNSRQIKVKSAEYQQQYLYEFEETHQETIWRYTATKESLVQPAEYEWQEYKTTKSEIEANSATLSPDVRIGSEKPAKTWFLAMQTGTDRVWVDSPSSPTRVVDTKAVVNETLSQNYEDPRTGEAVLEEVEYGVRTHEFSDYLSPTEIRERIIFEYEG